jgi:3-hydroxyisobutyrate dehydrogenase
MGAPMARNLHRAGLLQAVWNRSSGKATALAAELGCLAAASPSQLARECELLVMCVSADADVRSIVGELAADIGRGQILIDCSTVSADTARYAAALLGPKGAEVLDCPVSGGVEGAAKGTLAIMVGGESATLARAMPVLEAMGGSITHFGPHGAGQVAKAANQIVCAGVNRANAEALAFAKSQGLELDKVIAALGRGAAANWYLQNRGPNMASGHYPAGFRVRLHQKDLLICRAMAAAAGSALPVVEETLADYAQLIGEGYGDEDISALFRLKSKLFSAK